MSLMNLVTFAAYAAAAGGILFGVFMDRQWRPVAETSRGVALLGTAWVAFFLLENWILGPSSFISMNSEGDLSVPIYNFLAVFHDGGAYTPRIAGGMDIHALLGFGTQVLSFERVLIGSLPIWIAVLVMKALPAGLGFLGSFLLARDQGAPRDAAVALGALYTVSHAYFFDIVTIMGLGYGLLPLAMYLAVARSGRKHHLLGIVFLGGLCAFAMPVYVGPALLAALLGGAVMLGRLSVRTLVLPLGIAGGFMVLNWHDPLLALAQMSEFTIRGIRGAGAHEAKGNLVEAAEYLVRSLNSGGLGLGLICLAAVVQFLLKDRRAWRTLAATGAVAGTFLFFVAFPWNLIGLGAVQGISFHVLFFAFPALSVIPMAQVLERISKVRGSARVSPAGVVLAAALGIALYHKILNLGNWLYYGGQAQYTTIENLAVPDWAPDRPFRVVTLRHQRPEPNLVHGLYGLWTFDAAANLVPANYSRYWIQGILRGEDSEGYFGRLPLFWTYFRNNEYHLEEQVDLGLLRAAGVSFVLSPVPLAPPLETVSGPETPPPPPGDDMVRFLEYRIGKVFSYGKIYVGALEDALPLVFPAQGIHRVAAEPGNPSFLAATREFAPKGIAVVHDGDLGDAQAGKINIQGWKTVRNGYDIDLSAPDGGILIVNTNWFPYWRAQVDGKEVPAVSANLIHTAIPIPAGGRHVRLIFERTTAADRIAEWMAR